MYGTKITGLMGLADSDYFNFPITFQSKKQLNLFLDQIFSLKNDKLVISRDSHKNSKEISIPFKVN